MRRNKLYSLLLSVILALGLWLYVVNNVSMEDDTTISNIPVVLEGETVLGERNLMLTEIHTPTVSLHLRGPRSELSKVNAGNIVIKADLSTVYEPSDRKALTYTINFPGSVASDALVTESRSPSSVYVSVDYRRVKEVPVVVKWTGTRSGDYLYDTENAVLDNPTVMVVGPSEVADQIEQAVIEVDLSQRQESVSESFRYTLCDGQGEPVDAQSIMTNVEEIRLDMQIQRIKELPLEVEVVYGGGATRENTTVKLSMDSIRVSGSDAVLETLGDSFKVCTIDLKNVERNTEQLYGINLPEGVTNQTGVNEVNVAISFRGLRTKEFVIENIKSVNVPEGLEAEIFSANLTVKVRGPEEQIAALTDQDIYAEVDFSGAEVGTATYPAAIRFVEGFDAVGALKGNSVSATVREKE